MLLILGCMLPQPVMEASLWVLRFVLTLCEALLPNHHKLRVLALPDLTRLAATNTVRGTLPSALWSSLGRFAPGARAARGKTGECWRRRRCRRVMDVWKRRSAGICASIPHTYRHSGRYHQAVRSFTPPPPPTPNHLRCGSLCCLCDSA